MSFRQELEKLAVKPSRLLFVLKVEGNCVERVVVGRAERESLCLEKRGAVNSFSAASRRRFLVMVNKLDSDTLGDAIFITLTYPATYIRDGRVWKRDLDRFLKRLARRCKNPCVIWKLEFQKRGAPHFHLVVLERRYVQWAWIAKAWNEIVDGGVDHLVSGTHVTSVTDGTSALWYIAGYLGKQAVPPDNCRWTGRWWGKRGRPARVVRRSEFPLTDSELYDFVRFARRLQEARGWRVSRAGEGYRFTFMPGDVVVRWHTSRVLGSNGIGVKLSLAALDQRQRDPDRLLGMAGRTRKAGDKKA